MKLTEIVAWLDATLRIADYPHDVSNNGLQVARTDEEVAAVAFAVDASLASVQAAARAGAQLLVVHHGLSWGGGIRTLTGGVYRVVKAAIQADLAIYACHLPLDAHPTLGNNVHLAAAFGITDMHPAFTYHGYTIGLIGHDAAGKRVGVCSGGAGEFAEEAAACGCVRLITGEASWGDVIAAENVGIQLDCRGHYETETSGVYAVSEALAEALKVKTIKIARENS